MNERLIIDNMLSQIGDRVVKTYENDNYFIIIFSFNDDMDDIGQWVYYKKERRAAFEPIRQTVTDNYADIFQPYKPEFKNKCSFLDCNGCSGC